MLAELLKGSEPCSVSFGVYLLRGPELIDQLHLNITIPFIALVSSPHFPVSQGNVRSFFG